MKQSFVDAAPVSDPLLRSQSLGNSVTLPVLGIDTHFDTNSLFLLGIIEEAFGHWRALPAAERSGAEPLRIRIVAREGSEPLAAHSPVTHTSAADKRLIIQSAGSIGFVDPMCRESVAYVTKELVADREHFRSVVLEAMTFALLCCFDRHPIHAAAVAGSARTVLLAGPSGSGKSTLAYLAHTAGIEVLGDDHVWVQLDPAPRIWGTASMVRLIPEGASRFPEIRRMGIADADGREKVAVPVGPQDGVPTFVSPNAVVCVLARGDRVMLERIAASDIEAELANQLSPGFDRFPERHPAVAHALAAGGGWRLTLSANPHDALPSLRRILDEE